MESTDLTVKGIDIDRKVETPSDRTRKGKTLRVSYPMPKGRGLQR